MKEVSVEYQIRKKVTLLAVLLLMLVIFAFFWRAKGLDGEIGLELLLSRLRLFGIEANPLIALGGVTIASVFAVPLAVIILACSMTWGPWLGLGYAILGASIGACLSFLMGHWLGHQALCRIAGERVNRLSLRLGKQGVLSVIVLRMLPIAPFAIVNMVAGTTHIQLKDFLIGTFFGMLPGAVAIVFWQKAFLSG